MPRKFFKRMSPSVETLRKQKCLGFLGKSLHDPMLWRLNRHSVALAFAIGLFMMWVPFPPQMVFSAVTAIYFRAHLAISIALVWVTNPITIPPMFYFAYLCGAKILGHQPVQMEFELSWEWFSHNLSQSWEPFLLGCLIMAVLSALAGYLVIKLVWRLHIVRRLQERKLKRRHKKTLRNKLK